MLLNNAVADGKELARLKNFWSSINWSTRQLL